MAKKKKESAPQEKERRGMAKFCAFWGLAIAAMLFIASAVLNIVGKYVTVSATLFDVFDILAKAALLAAIGIPAYAYVRGRGKNWKIFYWVALIIYALGVVFSVIHF